MRVGPVELAEHLDPAVLQKYPDGEAGNHLRKALQTLTKGGRALLPVLEGIPSPVLARWCYRRWLSQAPGGGGAAGPLMIVDEIHLPTTSAGPWWECARGGLLFLWSSQGALTRELPAGLQEALHERKLRLLQAQDGPPLALSQDWRNHLLRMDEFHGVAVDPSLKHLRRSLAANCLGGNPVHLCGEASTGKRSLVGWVHELFDEEPLVSIRGSQGQPQPGRWHLFDEVANLGEAQLEGLRTLLEGLNAGPPAGSDGRIKMRPSHRGFNKVLGKSEALVEVLDTVERLAQSDLSMLILGESGVGKESLARAIHEISGRSGPFVALDMGALSESLAESELFGHVKGAFTGAERERLGAFRAAQGGTLFLDEVGNLSPALQVRLLRILQEKQVTPLGSDRAVDVDARVVAATNADLQLMAFQGSFRQDLLGRLNAATVRVPALRERLVDLEELALHFLRESRPQACEPWCTPKALEILKSHSWPGNIRELANVIRYAAAVGDGGPIRPEDLGPLSPQKNRPTPLLTVHSGGEEALEGLLPTGLRRLMTMTTLSMPPFRDRSPASRRAAILSSLEGRPIHPDALRVLESAPWFGNLLEMKHRLKVLQAAPRGGVGPEEVRTYLPELIAPLSHAPIHLLLSPTRQSNGRVGGLTWTMDAGTLLLGRIRQVEELRRSSKDPRVSSWLDTIERACGDVDPACLDLSLLGRLSRAHLLIARDAEGLSLHLMPETGLDVRAASLDEDSVAVQPGQPLSLGKAGEIKLYLTRGDLYLHFFVFAGLVAFEQYAEEALLRAESARMPAGSTLLGTQLETSISQSGSFRGRPSSGTPQEKRQRIWTLSPVEVEALTDLVTSFEGGQFNRHVLSSLATLRNRPACQQLFNYLEEAPRKAQYLVRIYEKSENVAASQHLRERLEALPDGNARLKALPVGLQRICSALNSEA